MYEKEKQQLIDTALEMLHYQLIALTGGNVSVRLTDGTFLVTPSAMRYETMRPEDIVRVDSAGAILEGKRKPTSDLAGLLYIYNRRPEINAIIHTHQPYATAAGLIGDSLPACLTTIIDTNFGDVPVAPFTVSSDEGMGRLTMEYGPDSYAVSLKNHGVIGMGATLGEALETVVYLEEGVKCYLAAKSAGQIALLNPEQIAAECEPSDNYGQ